MKRFLSWHSVELHFSGLVILFACIIINILIGMHTAFQLTIKDAHNIRHVLRDWMD